MQVSKENKQVPPVWAQSLLIPKRSMPQLSYSHIKLLLYIEEGIKLAHYEVKQLRDIES